MARQPYKNDNPRNGTARDRRIPFNDLPPDRQAEIIGQKQARSDRRKNTYRPTAPAIIETIEIHTAEIQLAYTKWFVACNEYAVAIDYVARERLTDRADYNRYLDEFDAALAELSATSLALFTRYEDLSNGGRAKSPKPSVIDARIQSKRSMQLLNLFKQCDDTLLMISFLSIYGDLPERQAASDAGRISNSLYTCLKALRKVKVNCFKRIIEAEALSSKSADKMTIDDLEAARKNKTATLKDGSTGKPSRTRKRKPAPLLDPTSPASEPVSGATPVADTPLVKAQKTDMNDEADEQLTDTPADTSLNTAAE